MYLVELEIMLTGLYCMWWFIARKYNVYSKNNSKISYFNTLLWYQPTPWNLWTWYDQLERVRVRGKNRMKNFWRKMRVNVKLRSKKLRTMSNEMSKLSSWMKMEAVKMTSGSGSRFSMAQERPVHQPLWLFRGNQFITTEQNDL